MKWKKGFEIRTVATFRIRLMIFFPLNLVNQIDSYQNEIFIPLAWLGNARLKEQTSILPNILDEQF